jgi:hypothetical protein
VALAKTAVRSNVIFEHPAEFVPLSPDDGVLSAVGADWFVSLLRQIPGLQIDSDLCQEDWGVVFFVQRGGKRFWIGLCSWPDAEHMWLAHFHHRSSAWLQRLSASGNNELKQLVSDAHAVLSGDPSVSRVAWYKEQDVANANAHGSKSPVDG